MTDQKYQRLQNFLERPFIKRNWHILFMLLVLFPIVILYGRYLYAPSDDMYIFLVYAKNFIQGNGLTYNGTVVEGFTSAAWVALLTLIGFTKIPLPQLAEGLSMLSGLLALFTTYKLAKSMGIQNGWIALIPATLLAVTGDFAFYSVVGLEEVLFTALITLCMALVYSQPAERLLQSNSYPLLNALVILTRPEGALLCALLFLIMLRKDNLHLVIQCGLKLILFLAPVLLLKRYYYGYWLPNTWYAKGNAGLANMGQGAIYFIFNIRRYLGVFVIMAAILVYGLYRDRSSHLRTVLPLLSMIFVWFVYMIIQGGDNMVGGRFLLPIIPALYCVFVKYALEVRLRPAEIGLSTVVLGISLIYGYVADPGLYLQAQSWRDAFSIRKDAGMYLHDNFPKDTVVALNPAGIIPFYSELETIDMLGLNDIHIAHEGKRDYSLWYAHQAGDGAYVLSRKPDIIIFTGRTLSAEPGEFISDREIWDSAEFKSDYKLVEWQGIGFVYERISAK